MVFAATSDSTRAQQDGGALLFEPSIAVRAVATLHGGSLFKAWQPDSFRIRVNRRSAFNYSWDILLSPI